MIHVATASCTKLPLFLVVFARNQELAVTVKRSRKRWRTLAIGIRRMHLVVYKRPGVPHDRRVGAVCIRDEHGAIRRHHSVARVTEIAAAKLILALLQKKDVLKCQGRPAAQTLGAADTTHFTSAQPVEFKETEPYDDPHGPQDTSRALDEENDNDLETSSRQVRVCVCVCVRVSYAVELSLFPAL